MDREEFLAKEMGWSYVIDDSKMPSAEESKNFVFPKELEEESEAKLREIDKEFGLC